MEDVNQALQELTTRQQERNYYTSNVPRTGKMYPSDKGKQTSVNGMPLTLYGIISCGIVCRVICM